MKQIAGLIPYLPPLTKFALDRGWYHQLGLVGSFRIAPTNTNRLEVELDFRAKSISSIKGSMDKRARFWVNLTQAHSLIVSSLWDASGHITSDGQEIRGQPTPAEPARNYPVLPAARTFLLGASPSYLAQIGSLFPSRTFKNSLLGVHPEAWVLVREEAERCIIVPCFELLRTFYYVDGAKLVRFFFSHEPLSSVCHVLEQPTEANGGKAHVVFVSDGLTDLQYCTLAELALNPAFRQACEQTHGRLLGEALKRTAGTYPRIDFQLGRDIRVDATGFSFTAENKEYFWVCAIRSHTPIWSFQHLEFETVLNHARNSSEAGTQIASPDGRTLSHPQAPALPTLTGELAGSSQHSGVEGESVLEASSALPRMTQVPKEERLERYPGKHVYFTSVPSCFTYEAGSDDVDDNTNGDGPIGIGDVKGSPASPPPSLPPLPLPDFFEEIVTWFTSRQEFSVTVLTVNNSGKIHGERTSVFPYWWSEAPDTFFITPERIEPRPIAIACIQLGQCYFYFFQLLDGGRAALIFYKGFRMLEEVNINTLLAQLAADGGNWDRVRKTYKNSGNKAKEEGKRTTVEAHGRGEKEKADQRFRTLMGLGLEIVLHNHTRTTQGTPSAAALCEKELRQLVLKQKTEMV